MAEIFRQPLLETVCQFMNFKLVPGTTINNQPMWILEGTRKAETTPTGRLRFYVGQQDGFTYRIEEYEKSQNKPTTSLDYSKLKFNEKLDDSMFQYKPPAGVQVIDSTDMTAQMIQQGGITPPTPAP